MWFCAMRMEGKTYVAMHTGDVPKGTFRSILKQAEMNEEEFKNL